MTAELVAALARRRAAIRVLLLLVLVMLVVGTVHAMRRALWKRKELE